MSIHKKYFALGAVLVAGGLTGLAAVTIPNPFTAGTTIKASEVNDNFSSLKAAVDALETSGGGKQVRVAGVCAAGSSIREVKADGTVTCQVDDAGPAGTTYTAGAGLALVGSAFSIADGGVTGAKLTDGSVSTAKLAVPLVLSGYRANLNPRGALQVTNTDTSLLGGQNDGTGIEGRQGAGYTDSV